MDRSLSLDLGCHEFDMVAGVLPLSRGCPNPYEADLTRVDVVGAVLLRGVATG